MKNNKILNLFSFVLFISMLLIIFLLFTEREDNKLLMQNLKQELKLKDSISDYKIKKYLTIIRNDNHKFDSLNKKKNSVRGFSLGNKSISVDELLNIANDAFEENSSLKNEVANNKLILEYIEKKYGVKTYKDSIGKIIIESSSQSKNDQLENILNETIVKLSTELEEKKFILTNLQKRYNFKYEVKTEKDKIKSTIYNTKLDSALWLYPYYKHKFKVDKNGNLIIK